MTPDAHARLETALADRVEIALAYLFGSAARGDVSTLSDIDVGVLLTDGRGNLLRYRARLAEELTRAAGGTPVQVVLLDEAPPALAAAAVRDGKLLVCRDETRRIRFETRTLQRDLDTAHLRRLYDRTLREAIRQGRFYG